MPVLLVVLVLGAVLLEAVANAHDELQHRAASTADTLGAGTAAILTGNAAHAAGMGSSAPQQHPTGPTADHHCSHVNTKGLCIPAAHPTMLQVGAGHWPSPGPRTGEAAVADTEVWLCSIAVPAPRHQHSLPSIPWAAQAQLAQGMQGHPWVPRAAMSLALTFLCPGSLSPALEGLRRSMVLSRGQGHSARAVPGTAQTGAPGPEPRGTQEAADHMRGCSLLSGCAGRVCRRKETLHGAAALAGAPAWGKACTLSPPGGAAGGLCVPHANGEGPQTSSPCPLGPHHGQA